MRSKWFIAVGMFLAVLLQVGCGTNSTNIPGVCPTCGTTVNGAYGVIDVIPVPEHNPTGEPGGPFNSFDISVTDSAHRRFYVSDRIGLDIPVFDMDQYQAVYVISGANGVAAAGDFADVCNPLIPPIVTALGNLTRYGCRNDVPGATITWSSAKPIGFGANGLFGGFPGAQCCAARANGVNPISGPDGEVLSPDGKMLFASNGSSSIVALDVTCAGAGCTLQSTPPVLATIPTGASPDYDGCLANTLNVACLAGSTPNNVGIGPCIQSANGRAFSDPTCGDLRADESSIGVINGRTILFVANGDPGFPFVTLIDVTEVLSQTGTTADPVGGPFCAAGNNATDPYYPAVPGSAYPNGNFPKCILGQIYWDNAPGNDITVQFDTAPAPCPDPSTTAPSGVSGPGGGNTASCHHAAVINPDGSFCASQNPPSAGCFGEIALAGIGGNAFNPNTGHFLQTNGSASPFNLTVGTIDDIDPRLGNPAGPAVVNSFPMPNCMPTSIIQGPGNEFLVGCADHDGETFPPNEYIIDGTTGKILATIDQVGGVDEIWYNPTDNRYYLAARDMPNGPVMGVIDAGSHRWLVNVPTGSNSHSIAVDSLTNHAWVPLQSGGRCTVQSSNGCIGVYAQQ